MNRIQVLRELETLIVARLFRSQQWLADRETVAALNRRLTEMGLQESVPGDPGTVRATPFGRETNWELLLVFLGLLHEWDVPFTLEQQGLLQEWECDYFLAVLEGPTDPEFALRDCVQKAYCDYYNPAGLLH